MGDHDGRPPGHQFGQRLLNLALAFGVEGAGCLVQQQDRRILQHGPGDGNALTLAARQLDPARADLSVVALGKSQDEVVCPSVPGRSLDLLGALVRLTVGDVRPDAVVEQHDVLAHQGDLAADAGQVHVAQGLSVDRHAAGGRVVEARDQVQDRGLARAGGANQRDRLAGRCLQANGLQGTAATGTSNVTLIPTAGIAEIDVFQPDFALGDLKGRGLRSADDLWQPVHQVEDARGCRQTLLQVGVQLGQALERFVGEQGGGDEGREGAGVGGAVNHLAAAVDDDGDDGEAAEDLDQRVGQVADLRPLELQAQNLVDAALGALHLHGLRDVGLHMADALKVLVQQRCQFPGFLLGRSADLAHAATQLNDRPDAER